MSDLAIQRANDLNKYSQIIEAIRHNDFIDMKTIAEKVPLSLPTVKNHVELLVEKGLIRFDKTKPSRRYTVSEANATILGIAIGATTTSVGIIRGDFTPLSLDNSIEFCAFASVLQTHIGTAKSEKDTLLFNTPNTADRPSDDSIPLRELCTVIIKDAISVFYENDKSPFLAIGISLPGIVDKKTETVSFCPNIPHLVGTPIMELIDYDLRSDLIDKKIQLHFSHDTIAATVFEKEYLYFSNSPNYNMRDSINLATLYLGYGMGSGFIFNNTLCFGSSGAIGEAGHIPVEKDELKSLTERLKKEYSNPENNCVYYKYYSESSQDWIEEAQIDLEDCNQLCACGKNNCMERVIRIMAFNSTNIYEFREKTNQLTLAQFVKNNPFQYELLKFFLAKIISMLSNVLNPDLLILTGAILQGIPQLGADLNNLLWKYSIPASASYCRIRTGSGHSGAVALGAAIMAYYQLYQKKNIPYTITW